MPKAQSVDTDQILEDEYAYYEKLYGGSDVDHFSKPAVVAFRQYLVARLMEVTGAGPDSKVLSIGCGVGDTELLMAPRVGHVTGIDLSPSAIRAANRSAGHRGLSNTRFLEGSWPALPFEAGTFDVIIAVFFLHHLSDPALASFPRQMQPLLREGGRFYALEPSARRLSGFLGKLLVPNLMKKYQTENERQLLPASTSASFRDAGLVAKTRWFDFCSTPVAGLFPSWPFGYRASRRLDAAFTACPGLRALSSNFELIAHWPARSAANRY